MKTALVLLALSFAGASFAGELDIHMHSTTTFKKGAAKDSLEKISEVVISDIALTLSGQTSTDSKKEVNDEKLAYTIDKNVIRIQDEKAAVDTEVAAKVERSIFGKIKSFTIAGDSFENAYFQSLQNRGIVALADLDLQKNQRKSLAIGDVTCSVDKSSEITTCEQDIDVKANNNGIILTAALLSLELGQ
jgi:hypothetical protein